MMPTSHRYLCAVGLTKSAAFRGSQRDVGVDERVAVAFNIQGASVADILRLAYPSLYALHDPQRAVAGAGVVSSQPTNDQSIPELPVHTGLCSTAPHSPIMTSGRGSEGALGLSAWLAALLIFKQTALQPEEMNECSM
jgi:hypothetical protein